MQVAYLINHYPAISHTFIRREINALEDQGVTIHRYALRGWDSDLVDPLDHAELENTRFTLKDGLARLMIGAAGFAARHPVRCLRGLRLALGMARKSERAWPYHVVYLAHACKVLRWLKGSDVTHLHAHFGTNSAEIAAIIHAMGGPEYSFTIHGSEVFEDPKHHALPLKCKDAHAIMASCAYISSQIKLHIPHALWPKVHVVHCGLAPTAFESTPMPIPDRPLFLSVGRFSPEKGHLVLLEAFAKLLETHPDASLVLAGDGPMRSEIEMTISKLGLEGKVRITGWVTSKQVQAELRAARALVHPSFIEGLPVVIMEAMAERRPVVSTYIAGIPELVQDGKTGWLVPAGQVDDLATAMKACAELPADAAMAMGCDGFDRVRQRHDAMNEATRLRTLFAEGAL